MFRLLAVFPDSFDLQAAVLVAAPVGDQRYVVEDVISLLVDKSLISVSESGAGYRYRLLETLRHYGYNRLVGKDEQHLALERLLTWAMSWVERLESDMRTPRQDRSLAAVRPERLNIRAALDWALSVGSSSAALRIASAVPVMLNGERQALLMRLLAELPDLPDEVRGHANVTVCNIAFEQTDWQLCRDAAHEAAKLFARTGNTRLEAWAYMFDAFGSWGSEEFDGLDRALALALNGFRGLEDSLGLAYALWCKSQRTSDRALADAEAEEAERRFRQLDAPIGLAHSLEGRGLLDLNHGDRQSAAPRLEEALGLFAGAGNLGCVAHCIDAVAVWLLSAGAIEDAATLLSASRELRQQAGGQGLRPWERTGTAMAERAIAEHGIVVDAHQHAARALTADDAVARATTALRAGTGPEATAGGGEDDRFHNPAVS